MSPGKWTALLVIAISIVLGLYFVSKIRTSNKGDGDLRAHIAEDKPVANNAAEPTMPLGSLMAPLNGRWLPVNAGGNGPELPGKVVLLDFWGIFCPPCIAAIPSNNRVAEKFASRGLVVAGVSTDTFALLEDFKKSRDVRYALLSSDSATFDAYEIKLTPSLFLFDKSGKLVWKGNGVDDPKTKSIDLVFEKALLKALSEPDDE